MLLSSLPTRDLDLSFLPHMPTKTRIFDPDIPDNDEDDDLPPLIEAPPCADVDDEEGSERPEQMPEQLSIAPGEFQLTFTRTMTPSFFGAPSDASLSALVSDAPSPSPPIPQHPPGLMLPPRIMGDSPGQRTRQSPNAHVRGSDAPSPSNADLGSPSPSPALSPITTNVKSQAASDALSSPSLDFDSVREPASGPQRTTTGTSQPPTSFFVQGSGKRVGAAPAQGVMLMGPPALAGGARPPSYIPRPPNAFILFRAAFVRTHRLGPDGTAVSNAVSPNASALDPSVSMTTITPSISPGEVSASATTKKGRGGKEKGESTGGSTATLSKLAGQLWRSLPPHERAVWEEKARAAQAEHRKKYPDWRFRPENASGVLGADDWGGGGSGTGPGGGRGGGLVVFGAAGANFTGGRGAGKAKKEKKSKAQAKTEASSSRAASELGLPSWATEGMGFDDDKKSEMSGSRDAKESKSDAGIYGHVESVSEGNTQAKLIRSNSTSTSSSRADKGKVRASDAFPPTNLDSMATHGASTATKQTAHSVASASVSGSGNGSGTSSITVRPPPSSTCSPHTTLSELESRKGHQEVQSQAHDTQDDSAQRMDREKDAQPLSQSVPSAQNESIAGSNNWFTVPLTAIARRSEVDSGPDPPAHPTATDSQAHAQVEQSPGIPALIPSTSASVQFFPRGGYHLSHRLLAHEFEFGGDFFSGSPGSPVPGSQSQSQVLSQGSKTSADQHSTRQHQRANSGVVRTNSLNRGHARTRSTGGSHNQRPVRGAGYSQEQTQVQAQGRLADAQIQTQMNREHASPPPLSPALSSPISGGSSHYAHSLGHSVGGHAQGAAGIYSPSSHSTPSMGSSMFGAPSRYPPSFPMPPPPPPRSAGNALSSYTTELSPVAARNEAPPFSAPAERIDASTLGYAVGPTLEADAGQYESSGAQPDYSGIVNWDVAQTYNQPQTQAGPSNNTYEATSPTQDSNVQGQPQQRQAHANNEQAYSNGASALSAFGGGPSGSSATAQPSFFHHVPTYGFQSLLSPFYTQAQSTTTSASVSPNPNHSVPGTYNPFNPSSSSAGAGYGGLAYSPTVETASGQGFGSGGGAVSAHPMGYANSDTTSYYSYSSPSHLQPHHNIGYSETSTYPPTSVADFFPYAYASMDHHQVHESMLDPSTWSAPVGLAATFDPSTGQGGGQGVDK